MRPYEIMYIVQPTLDEEATKAIVERFSTLIANNGEVEKVDEIGKRRLAYEIEGFNDGYYVLMNFKAEPDVVKELERQIGLTEAVIRHLIVNDEE